MKQNVLITSAGRRTSLVKAFAEAVQPRGGLVIAADMDGLAPSLYIADRAHKVPPVWDPSYIDALLDLVTKYEVSTLVPTIDPELLKLAENRGRFAQHGCIPVISTPEFVRITNDKWLTVQEFAALGFKVPRSWLPEETSTEELPETLFVKPREGSASQHTYRVLKENLHHVLALVQNPIIQEYVDCPEITVDALLDMSGRPVHYVIRRRIKTIGGESVEGVTLDPQPFHDYLVRLLSAIGNLGGAGPVTLQLFLGADGPVLSEINPRFGGGFPLAWAAGARYPEWILDMTVGKPVTPMLGNYKVGLYMSRHYVEIIRDDPLWR
jgi:carbamoyl-phosphate synthase large subunit